MDEEPRNWGCLQAFFVLAIVVGFTTIAITALIFLGDQIAEILSTIGAQI